MTEEAGDDEAAAAPPEEVVRIEERDGWRVPVVAGQGAQDSRPLGAFVGLLHEAPVSALEGGAFGVALDRDGIDAALVYCAERACEEAKATCPGCRLRSKALGYETVGDVIADHAEIRFEAEGASLRGPGQKSATFTDFKSFERDWAGAESWFLARRVLRKLRHGLRRSGAGGARIAGSGETPSVILVEPQLADNIGMVARAMANFGLDDLRLVAPRDGWPNEKARVAASGANYVIDDATGFGDVASAIGDLNYVVATTARQRDLRKPVLSPQQAAEEMSRRIAAGQRCGMMFGKESSGLQTDDLKDADALVMIPVNSRFASLNLAQAVLLLGYAFMLTTDRHTLGRVTAFEKPLAEGVHLGRHEVASKAELIGLFEHLEAELDRGGFFNPSHRRPTVVRNLRTMLTRMEPTSQEVRTLRGMIVTLSRSTQERP